MMLLLIAALGQRTLVIVHTKDLLDQWITRAKDVFGEDFEVGLIGDGEHIERKLTIATVQTLSRMGDLPVDWVQQWGTVILDECHRAPAVSFADVMQQMTARYMYGATATPKRRDGMHPLLHAIIGPIVATVPKDALVAAKKLMQPTVEMVPTDFWCTEAARMETAANQFMRNQWYGKIVTRLAEDEERAQIVAQTITRFPERHQLILSDRIGHLYLIAEMLEDLDPMSSHFVLTGKHSSQQRQEVIEGVRTGYFKRLFATQLADEGLDIPILDVLHLTFPRSTKGEGQKITQQIGRIMRTADGKQTPLVLDYVDERVAVLRNQGQARFEHYRLNEMEVSGWIPEKYKRAMAIRDKVKARKAAARRSKKRRSA
jgi:superfamily II DNA or RNA helicase